MLPDTIIEPVTLAARPPLPVGRKYALRFLRGVEGKLPMPDVDIDLVRRHCVTGLRQTILRDFAAVATVVTAALLAPWSTIITFALIAAVIVLVKRVRFSSPLAIAAATGAAVALIGGWRSAQESYAIPLISLGIFFLIYFVDIFWSLGRVRSLSRMPPAADAVESMEAVRVQPVIMPFEPESLTLGTQVSAFRPNGHQSSTGGKSASMVYYDKNGIIGAGTSFSAFPLTIPIDKALDTGKEIATFTEEQLHEYIARQVDSQGVGDKRAHGYARIPGFRDGDGTGSPVHFTYGLPYLDVDTVIAGPLPAATRRRFRPGRVIRLEAGLLSVQERSPSVHPERNYTRAVTASWDGQLVVSVYASAALQGHYLRMVIRPYVLGPIISDLGAVDELVERHTLIRTYAALRITALQFFDSANRLRAVTANGRRPMAAKDPRPTARSTRERYAQLYIDNMHQTDDADRIIRIVELKIASATMEYLKSRNIAIGEYEARVVFNIENQVIGGGTINSGTFTNSPVTNVSGQGNTATATTTTTSPPV